MYMKTKCNLLQFETSDLGDLTVDYFAEELDNPVSSNRSQQSNSNGGSGSSTPTGSVVGDRIQMLGGTQQGFKRPVAPGRRRPQTNNSSSSTNTTSTI